MTHSCRPVAEDIIAYLHAHERKELLRFITCGSVDDGKSTLIGRLLYESQDALRGSARGARGRLEEGRHAGRRSRLRAAARRPRGRARAGDHDRRRLPLLLDRPSASSSSPTRPGTSSTRATWSPALRPRTCAMILVDARKGVLTQTRRHSFMVSLLGIRHVASRSTRWTWSTTPRSASGSSSRSTRIGRGDPRRGQRLHSALRPQGRQRDRARRPAAVVRRARAARATSRRSRSTRAACRSRLSGSRCSG